MHAEHVPDARTDAESDSLADDARADAESDARPTDADSTDAESDSVAYRRRLLCYMFFRFCRQPKSLRLLLVCNDL